MKKEFIEELEHILKPDQILLEEELKRHTTFRVGGPADVMVRPEIPQIMDVMALAKKHEIPVTVIGNGSNLLVGDKGIRGLVIELGKNAQGIELDGTNIKVEAGCILGKAANEAASHGLAGMEFAAGIPGSVGGAVVMNAGAYGGEICQIIREAEVLTPEGEVRTISRDDLELSYRHSCIPEKHYIVLNATFELSKESPEDIFAKMDELKQKRVEKQPLNYPSAGSTFKRPEGYFAGKLIMDAGLRGYQVGGAQVSEKHCGFVINRDNATAADIVDLMRDVSRIVEEKYHVTLEPEVKKLGEF